MLALLCVTAGPSIDLAEGATSLTLERTKHTRYIQAAVYSGDIRVTLMVELTTPATRASSQRVILRLDNDNQPLSNRSVLLSVSRPLRSRGRAELMRRNGITYQSSMHITESGMWELLLQFRDASERMHLVPFLLRVRSGPHGPAWSIYPLFVPLNGSSPAVSLPLDPFVVDVQAIIAPFGQIRFQIRLRSQTRHPQLPPRLRLDLTMLDMAMGQSYATAYRSPSGLYHAQGFLSMPGAWSVTLANGRVSGTAALVVGGHA